jgi:hypothetical protein
MNTIGQFKYWKKGKTIHHTTEHSCREAPNQAAVSDALVVDVATKYSCNCTKNCIFKVWTLQCRLLAWQFKQ